MSKVDSERLLLEMSESTESGPRVIFVKARAADKAFVGKCLEYLDRAGTRPTSVEDWDKLSDALVLVQEAARERNQQEVAAAAYAVRVFCGLVRANPLAFDAAELLEQLTSGLTAILLRVYITGNDHGGSTEVASMVTAVCERHPIARIVLTPSAAAVQA